MQNESLIVNIHHSTNKISADISGSEVWFESNSEFSCTDNFALWLSLPFAMRQGKNLHINGKISPKALSQARKLVSIWSTWVPDHFSNIEISVESLDAANSATKGRSLMLFFGWRRFNLCPESGIQTKQKRYRHIDDIRNGLPH